MTTTDELTTAHEFQVTGEQGWFTFRRRVTEEGRADYIDAYGGNPGKERWRSFRPEAVRNIRLRQDRGAATLRVVLGLVMAGASAFCIGLELDHGRLWALPALACGVLCLVLLGGERRPVRR